MKILHIINSLSCGGAENFVTDLCAEMSTFDDVYLLCYAGILDKIGLEQYKKLYKSNVKIVSLNIQSNYLKLLVPFLVAFHVMKIRPDVINAHLDQSEFFLSLSKLLIFNSKNILFIRTLHNTKISKSINLHFYHFISSKFDGTIACSPAVRESNAYKNKSIPNFEYIKNGISLPKIVRDPNTVKQERMKLHICTNDFILLSIGSFTPRGNILQKAQDLIIKAIAKINIEHSIKIYFLGDGSNRIKLEELSKSLGIYHKCIFLGKINNVNSYILASNALIMPSRFEGLPIAGIESVCSGLPIIVSDIEAFNEIALDNSLRCESENIRSIANSITFLMKNYDYFNRNAIRASVKFRQNFNISNVAIKYRNYYINLLTNN